MRGTAFARRLAVPIRLSRAVGLILLLASLVAWARPLLSAVGMVVFVVLPATLLVCGIGLVSWLLAIAFPRATIVVGTFRGFLLILGLTWLGWAMSVWNRTPLGEAWGGWLFVVILAGIVLGEAKLAPARIGIAPVVAPWGVLGVLVVAATPFWFELWWNGSEVSKREMGRWADRALAPLVDRLEMHRAKHGAYPLRFEPGVNGRNFPRENAHVRVAYAPLGLDDYALGVTVDYSKGGANFACGANKTSAACLTTGRGQTDRLPRFLGARFAFCGERFGTRGRWSLWRGSRVARAGPERLPYELEAKDPVVRAEAAAALGRSGRRAAIGPLARTLLHDDDATVRGRAAWALGCLNDPWALKALHRANADPAVTWAIARLEALPRKRHSGSSGHGQSQDDFERHMGLAWRHLRDGTRVAYAKGPGHAGQSAARLAAGTCMFVRADGFRRRRIEVALRPESGRRVEAGYVERIRGKAVFFNAFRIEDGRIEFRGLSTAPLGSAAPGQWIELQADLDFARNTAELSVNGEVVAADVPIVPHRFESETAVLVQLCRWGIETEGEALVDSFSFATWDGALD